MTAPTRSRPDAAHVRLPELVADLLETYYSDWLTVDNVIGRLLDVRPDANPESIRRALLRAARTNPLIETKTEYPLGHAICRYRIAERPYHALEDAS